MCNKGEFFFLLSFRLFSLGVTTANSSFPSYHTLCNFLCYTHHILKSHCLSPFAPAWQLHLQRPSTKVFTISPLYVSKPSKPSLTYFISILPIPGYFTDVLVLISIHLHHYQNKISVSSKPFKVFNQKLG